MSVRVLGTATTHNLFSVLRMAPEVGRTFVADDDIAGSEPVTILSHALWQQRYGSDPAIIGRTIDLSGVGHTVVGVMPSGFSYPGNTMIWIPAAGDFADDSRGMHRLQVTTRLRAGATLEAADTEMKTIAARLTQEYPNSNTNQTAWVQSVREATVGFWRTALLVLVGAVGLVLLIACANVANLLLARAIARHREVAIRAALGAGWGRLFRQFLTESLVLVSLGGLVGIGVAYWGVELLVNLSPLNMPRLDEVGLDGTVLAATAAVTLLMGAVLGVVPAVQARWSALQSSLREGGRGTSLGIHRQRMRQMLVVSEVALAVMLAVGAGLLVKSFWRLQQVEPGFEPEGVMTVWVSLPLGTYPEWRQHIDFHASVVEGVGSIPGVTTAASAYAYPLDPSWTSGFRIEGREWPSSPRHQTRAHESAGRATAAARFGSIRRASAPARGA